MTYPASTVTWPLPLNFTPVEPSSTSGTLNVFQPVAITYQSDATVPGTRASGVIAAYKAAYPNVNLAVNNPGWTDTALMTAMQAGTAASTWDCFRYGTPFTFLALGYCEPITDMFNAWPEKSEIPASEVAVGSYNGDVYLLPDEGDMKAGYWRKDLFAGAGYGTFNSTTLEYNGTSPLQMSYTELAAACQKVTQTYSSKGTYWGYISNNTNANGGMQAWLRGNSAQLYIGDTQSCTITIGSAPYYNKALDTLNFVDSVIPYSPPGFLTKDINVYITDVATGDISMQFGLDPNLDGQMSANPSSVSGVNVRQAIQPSIPLGDNPNAASTSIPPVPVYGVYYGLVKGTKVPQLAFDYLTCSTGFNAELSLVGNAAGAPRRTDVAAIVNADPNCDLAPWYAAVPAQWQFVDSASTAAFGSILGQAAVDGWDAFEAGSLTAENAIETYVNTATSGLQKAGVPAAPTTDL